MSLAFRGLNGEFLLDFGPNGGGVVFLRALICSLFLFFAASVVYVSVDIGSLSSLSVADLRRFFVDKFGWFGAIFGACYLSFYSRYSSQWGYLADLYNQISQSRAEQMVSNGAPPGRSSWAKKHGLTTQEERYCIWMAAYVADAIEMHLARKPIFRDSVISFLEIEGVRAAYLDASPSNGVDLKKFETWCARNDSAVVKLSSSKRARNLGA